MGQAFAALMRNYISGSIAVEDSLDLFNTAINLYCLNFVVLTHCIEEYHGIAIRNGKPPPAERQDTVLKVVGAKPITVPNQT